jgi:hypothetical protein
MFSFVPTLMRAPDSSRGRSGQMRNIRLPFGWSRRLQVTFYSWLEAACGTVTDIFLRKGVLVSSEWRGTQTAGKGCKAFVWWFDSIPRLHSATARLLHDDPSAVG